MSIGRAGPLPGVCPKKVVPRGQRFRVLSLVSYGRQNILWYNGFDEESSASLKKFIIEMKMWHIIPTTIRDVFV